MNTAHVNYNPKSNNIHLWVYTDGGGSSYTPLDLDTTRLLLESIKAALDKAETADAVPTVEEIRREASLSDIHSGIVP